MGFRDKINQPGRENNEEVQAKGEGAEPEQDVVATTTPPGESWLDQVQKEVQETGSGPDGEVMPGVSDKVPLNVQSQDVNNTKEEGTEVSDVNVNRESADLEDPQEVNREPKQVETPDVIFVPFEDFDARINQTDYTFRKDIPTRVTRDQANIYLESKKGYVKD